jgi:glycosyltransferase involved in cell wall biosynthesis/GT2 family glycosyltransferase
MLARQPLDWTLGAGRSRAEPPAGIEIVIPVYGAPDALRQCLASVAAHTDLDTNRILMIIDGPQPASVESQIAAFESAHHGSTRVLRNERRLGFVGSVNRGMSESKTDVILLNSDTVVTRRWLEKLVQAAYSSGDIGTVTPLSNHATLCSVPRPFEENLLPTGHDARSFGALVESCSRREYPRLPTGVGVCLYIRRAVIDAIGFFDTARFGLGYGEENDFCVRALAQGWLSVADDATFIEHAGHQSFRTSRKALQRKARATLRRLHPRYMATVAAFMKEDPLVGVRDRIESALGEERARPEKGKDESAPRKIVHVVHGWPPFQQAGTELYAYWLAHQQSRDSDVAVYARGAFPERAHGEAVELQDERVRVRLVTNNFTARNPLRRNAIRDRLLERDFERFLRQESPDLVHVHHLAGHAFSLVSVVRRLGIPIVLQLQDWWFLCARVNLLDREGNRCSGPELAKCARCATLTTVPPAQLNNLALHRLRRGAARAAIAACDTYIVGSNAIRNDYLAAGVIPAAKQVHVLPYGVELAGPASPRTAATRPIRFGYVGSIAPHKGVHTAAAAMRTLAPSQASLHVWGDASAQPDYVEGLKELAGAASLVFEGRFREDEKPAVFSAMDVLLVPSIGLESFGLAAREAMVSGVPVIASSGGALSEMFRPGECGDFFPPGDAAALRQLLRRVVDDPGIIDQWRAHLPVPKRNDVHVREIAEVYDQVLSAANPVRRFPT